MRMERLPEREQMRSESRLLTYLEGLGHMAAGSIFTLWMLEASGRGRFRVEAGFVILFALLVFAAQALARLHERGGSLRDYLADLGTHAILAAVFAAAAAILFAARFSFGTEAAGHWYVLPMLFFAVASWVGGRDEVRKPHG